jgi:hypothetical protein
LYLIVEALSDESQSKVLTAILEKIPSFNDKHRILFYETSIGKIAIVRQIKPKLHIEYDNNIYISLLPHISTLVYYRNNNHHKTVNQTTDNAKKYELTDLRDILEIEIIK